MSIEKGPEFRVIGGASPEKKEEVRRELHKVLFNHFESLSPQERKQMEEFEYKKSEEEKNLIDLANRETNRLRQEAGLEPYDIPYENYHLLPSKEYRKLVPKNIGIGATSFRRQGILLDADTLRPNSLITGGTFLHETLHLKGHVSMEAEEKDGEHRNTFFRLGVSAWGVQRGPHHGHFTGLNEAIVATQEKKFCLKALGTPLFQKEKEWLISNEAQVMIKKLAAKEGMPEDEIMWVDRKKNKISGLWFSYFGQRQVLDYVCSEIQKAYPQQYKDKDEVFKEFLGAHFTGRLLTIAKLVEKTFGDGSFRALGNMTSDAQRPILYIELLRKARARRLKKEKTS